MLRGVAHALTFVAWNTTANAGKTGDAANITLRWIKDGTSAALTTATITEVDATNCPGIYKVDISATEADASIGMLAGKSSTSGVSIMPVPVNYEQVNRPRKGVARQQTFLMVDATDLKTEETGLTVAATISKDGGAFASCTNSVSEVGVGVYKITLTATEMDANDIWLRFTASGAAARHVNLITQP